MLIKTEVYTSKQDVDTLEIVDAHRPDLDYLHATVAGLDPVTASISSIALPSTDVGVISGEEVPSRNIVLTIIPDPDWVVWKPEQLRRLIYAYFTPKSTVRLVLTTEELTYPVEIYGEVEACTYDQYAQDAEYQVSIICADPYFTSTHEEVITGEIIDFYSWPPDDPINIGGDVPIGCKVKLPNGYDSGNLFIQIGDPSESNFHLYSDSNPSPNIFEMDSRPLLKKIRTIESSTGIITSLLGKLESGYNGVWPILKPGDNLFAVMGDSVGDSWELRYFERYGGL